MVPRNSTKSKRSPDDFLVEFVFFSFYSNPMPKCLLGEITFRPIKSKSKSNEKRMAGYHKKSFLVNPLRIPVPFWGQTINTLDLSCLPPKRDCSPKRVTMGPYINKYEFVFSRLSDLPSVEGFSTFV